MKLTSLLGGLAGACALTIINQVVSRIDKNAPRLDLLGMNAVAKLTKGTQTAPFIAQKIFPVSVAGDLLSNSLYFALADGSSTNRTLIRGLMLGLGAGIGAVALPKPLGLDPAPTDQSMKTRGLTIAWYVIGGLVAAATIIAMDARSNKPLHSELAEHTPERVLAGI